MGTFLSATSLKTKRYNVVFIMVDDLKPKINAFGDMEMVTPNLDSFAETAVTFTRAYCQQSVCGASRASILSGLRPDTTGAWGNPPSGSTTRDQIDSNFTSLPQHFSNNSYQSFGISKIFHGGNNNSQDGALSYTDGWESHGAPHIYYGGDASSGNWKDVDNNISKPSATDAGETNYWATPARPVVDDDYPDGATAQTALSKLATYSQDFLDNGKNFFLAVGFTKPHLPFACPKSYWDLYDPTQIDLENYSGQQVLPIDGYDFTTPPQAELTSYGDITGTPTSEQARNLIHGYMACVSYVDSQIGKVIDALDSIDPSGALKNNTIVIVTGDHGWHLADHGAFWTKNTNFEEATQTPLMIRAPGMDKLSVAGEICTKPVELISLYPTLVDLTGLPNPTQPNNWTFEGPSMRTLLETPDSPAWNYAAFSQYHKNINGGSNGWGMGYSMRTSRFRYTEWYLTDNVDRAQKVSDTPAYIELYDHDNDPEESANVASQAQYADFVSALSTQLDGGQGWLAQLEEPEPEFQPSDELTITLQNLDASQSATIQVSGPEGAPFTLQKSSNLNTWTDELEGRKVVLDATREWTYSTAQTAQPAVFYRAVTQTETTPASIWEQFADRLEIYQDGDYMVIETENIPDHNSPYFPTNDPRYEAYSGDNPNFRINPNEIAAQNMVFRIPLNPTEANSKSNTRLGPIGIALNGVAFFNQYAGPNNQPLTSEVDSFDQYNGHPTGGDIYHYHFEPSFLTTNNGKGSLLGVLLDGFPVYGPEENGETLASDDLDQYHGHFGPTPEYPEGIYHYHFTADDPYLNGGQYFGTPGSQTN